MSMSPASAVTVTGLGDAALEAARRHADILARLPWWAFLRRRYAAGSIVALARLAQNYASEENIPAARTLVARWS